ncbi:hypothetical protein DFH29DRAFT_416855 [Suillus ampliporus]|nr:hypothetical protein DFH29DRAFT_416855 [Suillus ampliporus]
MGNSVQPMGSSFADTDLVACVLTSLPDFDCLVSAILTSKSIYNVFEQHPHSIVRSVAYNLVGPALPQALRLVRCHNAKIRSKPIGELLGEDDIRKNPVFSLKDITSLLIPFMSSNACSVGGIFVVFLPFYRSHLFRQNERPKIQHKSTFLGGVDTIPESDVQIVLVFSHLRYPQPEIDLL